MGQVPHYLIIGNGRVARHMCHYFRLLDLPYSQWHRGEPLVQLEAYLQQSTHILVLISDRVIEAFIDEHLQESSSIKIHFSGALVTDLAYGAHPLMTFNESVYTLDKYKEIPFIVDETAPEFIELLPCLSNPHVRLPIELKAKYHAMCVLSGNFSCLLWQKFFTTLETEFHIPPDIGKVYLQQQMQNLKEDYTSAFTGPLARGDQETINKNLKALDGDEFQQIYQSFVDVYERIKEKK